MPDELLHNELLGSHAVYRVVERSGDRVLLEVVEAPGLEPGFRFRVTAAAAAAMNQVLSVSPERDRSLGVA